MDGRELGRGTFGVVLLVLHEGLPTVVKKINLSSVGPNARRYQFQEITLLRTLSHENIVSYKDYTMEGDILNIYMEYCSGGDMYQYIRSRGRGHYFNEHSLRSWMRQLVGALWYIHNKGVLHRDLKPSNIFLDGHKEVVKIGDFGLARVFSAGSHLAQTTLGTPVYMAPEVLLGSSYDAKADMYSLGVSCAHMASLQIGRNTQVPSVYSSALRDLMQRLRADNPEDRPNAEDVMSDTATAAPPPADLQHQQQQQQQQQHTITIVIMQTTGVKKSIKVSPSSTVRALKALLLKMKGIPQSSVSITYEGTMLSDDRSLDSYNIREGSELQVIFNFVGGTLSNTRR